MLLELIKTHLRAIKPGQLTTISDLFVARDDQDPKSYGVGFKADGCESLVFEEHGAAAYLHFRTLVIECITFGLSDFCAVGWRDRMAGGELGFSVMTGCRSGDVARDSWDLPGLLEITPERVPGGRTVYHTGRRFDTVKDAWAAMAPGAVLLLSEGRASRPPDSTLATPPGTF